MRSTCISAAVAAALLIPLTGCPNLPGAGGGDPTIVAEIQLSAASGEPPLEVFVSGLRSSSTAGEITNYAWTIDGTTYGTAEFFHTFTEVGAFDVNLTVTDAAGNTASTKSQVSLLGDGAVTATIRTNVDTGPAPLGVQFDGAGSTAINDTIRDYFWDFNDGSTSIEPRPFHIFTEPTRYRVTLRVRSRAGNEDTTEKFIEAGAAPGASLQFNGAQVATLQLPEARTFEQLTVGAFFKTQGAGGALLTLGAQNLIVFADSANNEIRVQRDGVVLTAVAASLDARWRYLAVTFDAENDNAEIYLDGVLLRNGVLPGGPLTFSVLRIGPGYDGNAAAVRLFDEVRTVDEVLADAGDIVPVAARHVWPINDGSGQGLWDATRDIDAGFLGNSTGVEGIADPSWSADAPPL